MRNNECPIFLCPHIVLSDLPYIRINFKVAGLFPMTISIEIERGFYGLTLASSSFTASYRHATVSIVVAVVVGFSIFRLDPPMCEEIAKTAWRFRFGRNRRLSHCPIRFYSLLVPTWTNISLRVRGRVYIS